jgi:hypothetical protein
LTLDRYLLPGAEDPDSYAPDTDGVMRDSETAMRRGCLAFLVTIATACPLVDRAAEGDARPNSVLVFAGRLSTSDFASTALFNLSAPRGSVRWDNDIAGIEYERPLAEWRRGDSLRVESGIADRYGHYIVCCLTPGRIYHPDVTVYSNGIVNSYEVWLGLKIRKENFSLGPYLRAEFAFTVGLSHVDDSIGRERQREMDDQGSARLLGYLAPEIGFSTPSWPRVEAVMRLAHRSGLNGTFDHIREGYNAIVGGLRYSF